MRRCWLLFGFLLAGCGHAVTEPPPVPVPKIFSADHTHVLAQSFLTSAYHDSLASILGWQDVDYSFVVDDGRGESLLLVPLEAEDEIRWLTVVFQQGQITGMTALGLAETSDFIPARADTAAFEGWIFVYDLGTGYRNIATYREGETLWELQEFRPPRFLPIDLIAQPDYWGCLVNLCVEPVAGLRAKIFLEREWSEQVKQIVPVLPQFLHCRLPDIKP